MKSSGSHMRNHLPVMRVVCTDSWHDRPPVVATFRRHPELGWRWDKHPASQPLRDDLELDARTEPKRVIRPMRWGRYEIPCRCGLVLLRQYDKLSEVFDRLQGAGLSEVALGDLIRRGP
jgi:hypothetical protein